LSANFGLYGDMSNRMMSIAAGLGPEQEIYSIDESFIDLAGVRDVTRRAVHVRSRINTWIGIPCGVGIGQTKTLAKLANHVAKTAERKPGSYPDDLAQVANLAALPASDLDAVLQATELGEIWGIGRRIGQQLKDAGLVTALDVVRLDTAMVRARWGVVLERTVRELQGMPCVDLEGQPAAKKEIASTRSFGRPVTRLEDLIEAVTEFAQRAAEKLRRQGGVAGNVAVFVHTSPHRTEQHSTARRRSYPCVNPRQIPGCWWKPRFKVCGQFIGPVFCWRRPACTCWTCTMDPWSKTSWHSTTAWWIAVRSWMRWTISISAMGAALWRWPARV
jgi:DNA polymerase V